MRKHKLNRNSLIAIIILSIIFIPLISFGFADFFLLITNSLTSMIITLVGLIGYMLSIGMLGVIWMWIDSNCDCDCQKNKKGE